MKLLQFSTGILTDIDWYHGDRTEEHHNKLQSKKQTGEVSMWWPRTIMCAARMLFIGLFLSGLCMLMDTQED